MLISKCYFGYSIMLDGCTDFVIIAYILGISYEELMEIKQKYDPSRDIYFSTQEDADNFIEAIEPYFILNKITN